MVSTTRCRNSITNRGGTSVIHTATKNMFDLTNSTEWKFISLNYTPVYWDKIVMRGRYDWRNVYRVCCFILQKAKIINHIQKLWQKNEDYLCIEEVVDNWSWYNRFPVLLQEHISRAVHCEQTVNHVVCWKLWIMNLVLSIEGIGLYINLNLCAELLIS